MTDTAIKALSAIAKRTSRKSAKIARKAPKDGAAKPVLLAGGNPQVAKAEGDAPVRAYIAAMPGWKRDVGRRLDMLIARRSRRAQGGEVELAPLWH